MLKKIKLAQKDIKRTKVKKDCKTQEKPGFEPSYHCVADRYESALLTVTPQKLIERNDKFHLIS